LNQSIAVNDEKSHDTQLDLENRLARAPFIETSNIRHISVSMNHYDVKHNSDFYQSCVKDQSDDEDVGVDYESSSRSLTDFGVEVLNLSPETPVGPVGDNAYWNSDNMESMNELKKLEYTSPVYAPKHKNFLRKSVCKYRYSPKKSFNSPKIVLPSDSSQESTYFYHNKRLSIQNSPPVNNANISRSSRHSACDDEVKQYGEGYILFKGCEWQPHYMCINVKGILYLFKSHLECKEHSNALKLMYISEKSTQLRVVSDVGFVITNSSCSYEFECYNSDEMKAWFKIMANFIR